MAKRIQRPRLEQNLSSDCTAKVVEGELVGKFIRIEDAEVLYLRDAKRLHSFLTRAIAYLEQKSVRK